MSRLKILLCAICITNVESLSKNKVECGYKQCPATREGALNVHLVPHSHMDAGWVKTFDEYYHGTKTTISTANVQLIFHSVLSELLHDKRRKFTFSESAYFWRWWKEQRPATRAAFRTLVREGRAEVAGGGWTQNDEATLDYLQIIDLFTWGLRKINDTLGPCGKPRAAWQIDTYGHTREQASLLAQMGFDGLFIGRVDHKEREAMIDEDRMEFMWRGSDVLGKMSDIMTHTLFNLYNAPEGFCFDFLCSDEPIVDDPDNRAYNAEKRVSDFIAQIERQAKYYDHDNILVTMGGDFTYQGAASWFMNMDKLINHVNSHPANMSDVHIFYSTPSCYLKSIYLYGRRDKAVYTEKGDHMPYGSDSNTYWTGFYTSRPSLKYFIRRAHVFLQVVKQISVLAKSPDSFELHLLRHAANLVLHHDGITGTSQQHVTNDFVRTLSEAVDACTKKVSNLLSFLTPTWGNSRRTKNNQQFTVCHELNISQCRFAETQEAMLLLVYNPLSVKTYYYVKIPAIALHYNIRDYNDDEVDYQLVPLPAAVINLPGRTSTAIQELVFEAENVPPLGFTAYYITPVRDQLEENEYAKKVSQNNKNNEPDQEISPVISNEYIKVTVNKNTGLLESIQHVDGFKLDVTQNFYYYSQTQQALQSGAYSFRPERNRPTPVTEKVTYSSIRGPLVKEIRQRFADWITQVIRLYRGEEFVEIDWIVGPVPIGTDLGKEVVTLFQTNITNNGYFFTDSNGRQMMKRTCWNETSSQAQKKPISSCYYPVTSRICLESSNTSDALCLLVDRAQGATSFNNGEIEVMVHRRLLTDDGFGLEESLNEEAYGVGLVVKGKHRLVFGNYRQEVDGQTFNERVSMASRKWNWEPWIFMTPAEKINKRRWQNIRSKRFTALRPHGLPRHIRLLTLEPWKAGGVLLRLENTLEQGNRGRLKSERIDGAEDFSTKGSHISVQLRNLFTHLRIRRVRETTLAGNQWLDDARQMDWSTRYVYNGADDDILPEDIIEDSKPVKEDTKETFGVDSQHTTNCCGFCRKKPSRKSSQPDRRAPSGFSEEEQYYPRKKPRPENGRIKIKKQTYEEIDRRKRAIDENDNIINSTFEFNNTTEVVTTIVDIQTEIPITNITSSTNEPVKAKNDMSKLMFGKNKHKRMKFQTDVKKGSEEIASEEDFSSNLKKRSPRRKLRKMQKRDPEPVSDDIDDGITKSMYEMYYKSKPRYSVPARSSEENREDGRRKISSKYRRKNKNRTYQNAEDRPSPVEIEDTPSVEESRVERKKVKLRRKKNKPINADMPFFLTSDGRNHHVEESEEVPPHGKREEKRQRSQYGEPRRTESFLYPARRLDEIDYDATNIDDEERGFTNEDRQTEGRFERRKRASQTEDMPSSDQMEDTEPDFMVTLRPTQIRTFVVWFETPKKSYAA